MPSMPRQTIFLTPSNYKKTSIIPIGTARSGLCSIYFSPDGHYLAGATGRKIIVWQLQSDRGVNDNCKERWTRHVVYSLEPHDTSIITCMVWALDHSIVIGTSTGNLYFIQLSSSGTTLEGFQVSNHPIKFIALNSNSQLMAVVAGKREVGIWEFSATKDSWQGCIYLRSPEDSVGASREVLVTSVSWCNSEVPLLVVSYFHHGVLTWNLADLGVVSIVKTDVIPSATLSPDGQMMSIPNAKGTFDLYDLELKEKVATLYDPDEPVSRNSKPEARPGRFMYGGSWFIGGNGTSLRLWDVSSHLPAQRLCLGEAPVSLRLLAVSGTVSGDAFNNVRVAALGEGEETGIHIWTASFEPVTPDKPAGHSIRPSSSRIHHQQQSQQIYKAWTPWAVIGSFLFLSVLFSLYP